jgi:hypothetical protein
LSSPGKEQKIQLNLAKLFAKILLNMASSLYYKLMMPVNDDSRVINKLEASLTDDPRVVIYNRHMFIVQAKGW